MTGVQTCALPILPFALMGLVANAIPMAAVWLIGRAKVDDAVMATIKPLGALFVFTVTWGVWTWVGVQAAAIQDRKSVV